MSILKERIKNKCKENGISITRMLHKANMQSGDFYYAISGKRPFFPAWKKRIAEALEVSEEELFSEQEILLSIGNKGELV